MVKHVERIANARSDGFHLLLEKSPWLCKSLASGFGILQVFFQAVHMLSLTK
jgi:hypothetical protein